MAAILVCLILVGVTVEDLTRYRIRNMAVALLVGCFAIDAAFGTRSVPVLLHVLLAAVAFCGLAGLFALGGIGGGDAKLLGAALLWVGPAGLFLFSLALVASTLLYALGARMGRLPTRKRGGRMTIPFAPAISAAWIVAIAAGH